MAPVRVPRFLYLTAILVLCACTQPIKPTNPQTVALALIDSGALVLDVRSHEEFENGHLATAINTPVGNTDAMLNAIGADKQRLVVVYCGSGRRASLAQAALAEQGYYNVHNGTAYSALRSAGARVVSEGDQS